MPANMPKDGTADQPAWLGPVKVAVVVMSVLIILGVGLLGYGLATGIRGLDTSRPPLALEFPDGMEPVSVAPAAGGQVTILFRDQGQGAAPAWVAVTVDPGAREITGRVTLSPGPVDDVEILE